MVYPLDSQGAATRRARLPMGFPQRLAHQGGVSILVGNLAVLASARCGPARLPTLPSRGAAATHYAQAANPYTINIAESRWHCAGASQSQDGVSNSEATGTGKRWAAAFGNGTPSSAVVEALTTTSGGSRIGLLWGRRSSFGREWADRRRASVHSQIGPTSRTPRSGSLAPAWGVGGWQTHVLHVHVCSASLRAVSEVPTIQSCAFPIQHLSSRRPCDMAKNGTAPFRPTRQEEPGTPSPCRYHAGLNFLLAGRTSQWPAPEATNLWING